MTPAPVRIPLQPYSPKRPVFSGMKGNPVVGINVGRAAENEEDDDGELDDDDDIVEAGGFTDPDHEKYGGSQANEDSREVE